MGFTPNLRSRFKSHNEGKSPATKPNIPYELIHYQAFKSKKDALSSEKYFKTTSGWKRIKQMLKDTLE